MCTLALAPKGTTTNPYSAAHLPANPSFLYLTDPNPLLHKPPTCPASTTLANPRGHKSWPQQSELCVAIVKEHLALWPLESRSHPTNRLRNSTNGALSSLCQPGILHCQLSKAAKTTLGISELAFLDSLVHQPPIRKVLHCWSKKYFQP